eukprot:TRINITY_DN1355_c2_g1_i1.p1 TRINITY_DN1355_c2_g1~~TRINITY_DN1355_c2_g1_i1.p1  ORF type:complete len:320 (+),score=68.86 TRINITY_DN1355_c2_g1_i1:41-1000(+)
MSVDRAQQAKTCAHPPLVISNAMAKKYNNPNTVYIRSCCDEVKGKERKVVIVVTRIVLFVSASHKEPRMVKYGEIQAATYFPSKKKETMFEVVFSLREPEPDVHLIMKKDKKLNPTPSDEEEIRRFIDSVNRCRDVLVGGKFPVTRSESAVAVRSTGQVVSTKEKIEKAVREQVIRQEVETRKVLNDEESLAFQNLHMSLMQAKRDEEQRKVHVEVIAEPPPQPVLQPAPCSLPQQPSAEPPSQPVLLPSYNEPVILTFTSVTPPPYQRYPTTPTPQWRPVTSPSQPNPHYWSDFIQKWEDRAVVTHRERRDFRQRSAY